MVLLIAFKGNKSQAELYGWETRQEREAEMQGVGRCATEVREDEI